MSELSFIIDFEQNGYTINEYLRNHLNLSRKGIIRLKATQGGIKLNDNPAKVIERIKEGDSLLLSIVDIPEKQYDREDIPLDILYEDDNFLIVNKPSGMPMYPIGKYASGCLLNAVAFHVNITVRCLYRLDANTSGIVVIAKSRVVSSSVTIEKEYLAICHGELPLIGIINAKIGLVEGSKIQRATGYGQDAVTRFTRISTCGAYSLAKVTIETGRTHQIRVHMASIGFPLAGDGLYGGSESLIPRHALHCAQVKLKSVVTNTDFSIKAEVPKDIELAFKELFNK